MSEAHLLDLLHNSSVEMTFSGQTLFSADSFDGDHLYLLHGDVALTDKEGRRRHVKGRSTLMPLSPYQPRRETAVAEGRRRHVKGRSTLMPLSPYQPRRETAVAESDGAWNGC